MLRQNTIAPSTDLQLVRDQERTLEMVDDDKTGPPPGSIVIRVDSGQAQDVNSSEAISSECWICFDDQKPILYPCPCPRAVHAECLRTWQRTNTGTWKERYCEFCHNELPDWREGLPFSERFKDVCGSLTRLFFSFLLFLFFWFVWVYIFAVILQILFMVFVLFIICDQCYLILRRPATVGPPQRIQPPRRTLLTLQQVQQQQQQRPVAARPPPPPPLVHPRYLEATQSFPEQAPATVNQPMVYQHVTMVPKTSCSSSESAAGPSSSSSFAMAPSNDLDDSVLPTPALAPAFLPNPSSSSTDDPSNLVVNLSDQHDRSRNGDPSSSSATTGTVTGHEMVVQSCNTTPSPRTEDTGTHQVMPPVLPPPPPLVAPPPQAPAPVPPPPPPANNAAAAGALAPANENRLEALPPPLLIRMSNNLLRCSWGLIRSWVEVN